MKFTNILYMGAIIALLSTMTMGSRFELYSGNDKTVHMTYLIPGSKTNETMRVKFGENLPSPMGFGQSDTTICIRTQDSTYTPQVGDNAFGINHVCFWEGGCTDGDEMGSYLWNNTITSVNPVRWDAGGVDLSPLSIGSGFGQSGTNFDERFSFNESMAEASNIPREDELAYLRCYTKFDGNVRLNGTYTLTDWDQNTVQVQYEEKDYTCEYNLT